MENASNHRLWPEEGTEKEVEKKVDAKQAEPPAADQAVVCSPRANKTGGKVRSVSEVRQVATHN